MSDDLRSRAIAYARNQPLNIGEMINRGAFLHMEQNDIEQLRIAIDNVIAAGFEMGYHAAKDDMVPRRALLDRPRAKAKR